MTTRRWAGVRAVVFALLCHTIHANTEKAIFLVSSSSNLGDVPSQFEFLQLGILTHPSAAWSTTLRTSLPVAFPTGQQPQGIESWFLLDCLTERQRYEVRVCWAATSPTAFEVETFDVDQIVDNHHLLDSLIASQRRDQNLPGKEQIGIRAGNVLFLRIRAAADYFTTDSTLMRQPPPVLVDIILDPFLLNIFPQSLVYTAVYIVVLAVVGFYLSGFIWRRLVPKPVTKHHKE